jgi:hypothetical protein
MPDVNEPAQIPQLCVVSIVGDSVKFGGRKLKLNDHSFASRLKMTS